jgi:chemotaxis protein CheC
MERSTLGEMGNIMGSFFLNFISDTTGNRFQPSPPAVMMDMAGAVLDAALADVLAYSDDTYIVETVFGTNDRQVSGTFLVIPSPELEGL